MSNTQTEQTKQSNTVTIEINITKNAVRIGDRIIPLGNTNATPAEISNDDKQDVNQELPPTILKNIGEICKSLKPLSQISTTDLLNAMINLKPVPKEVPSEVPSEVPQGVALKSSPKETIIELPLDEDSENSFEEIPEDTKVLPVPVYEEDTVPITVIEYKKIVNKMEYDTTYEEPVTGQIKQAIDYTYYKELVSRDPEQIVNVPTQYITKELCLICVNHNGYLLKHLVNLVPLLIIDNHEIVKRALLENGLALQFSNIVTREMQEMAIKQNPWAIEFVDNKMTYHKTAIERDPKILTLFTDVVLDNDVYLKAVTKNGSVIEYVPIECQTVELVHVAWSACKKNITYVKNQNTLLIFDSLRRN